MVLSPSSRSGMVANHALVTSFVATEKHSVCRTLFDVRASRNKREAILKNRIC